MLCFGNLGQFKEVEGKFIERERPLLEEWTGRPINAAWNTTLGKGRIAYVPTESAKSPELESASKFVDLNHQLRIKAASTVETTVRSKGSRRTIHLIRLGAPDNLKDRSVYVDYELPVGCRIKSCMVLSPDSSTGKLKASWKQVGRRLQVDIDHLDTYGLIVVVNKTL